ncbi:MAG: acyl-CoA dehydrogenase family protein, partial [Chloroflexi bacterium]|nr:acyl-CoA dehydrogenase family protein [Chloroflexota bacterium]
ASFGTEEQKQRFLPKMATGEIRGGLGLTEPGAGSDVQNIQMTAVKDGEEYVLNGSKMFITNAENGNAFAVLTKTDREAEPAHRGISCFIVEKPSVGFTVGKHLDKLGYRGIESCELVFEDCRIAADNLVGETEGQGFRHVMSALETGRINIAARAVGVATAAFEAAIGYAQQRKTFGVPIAEHQAIQLMLADMATKIQAARLLTYDASARKDAGAERIDLEAGMAKLFASEMCGQVTLDAMRIHGGYGYIKDYPVERYYREAPLMIIGEGTNEIQKLVIARRLLQKYKI